MKDAVTHEEFGCDACFGASAEAFWGRWRDFRREARLVDAPHDIIQIASCPACGQHYVSVTTEFIDWEDGEDPIYRSILPVTAQESQRLQAQGQCVDARLIEAFGAARRHLETSWPKGEPQRVYWVQGGLLIATGG